MGTQTSFLFIVEMWMFKVCVSVLGTDKIFITCDISLSSSALVILENIVKWLTGRA